MLTAHSGANTPNGSAPPGRASGGASGGKTNTAARLVETLDLSPALRVKLVNAGFRTVEDLEHMTPAGLVQGTVPARRAMPRRSLMGPEPHRAGNHHGRGTIDCKAIQSRSAVYDVVYFRDICSLGCFVQLRFLPLLLWTFWSAICDDDQLQRSVQRWMEFWTRKELESKAVW